MGFWSSLTARWRDRSVKLTDIAALIDQASLGKTGQSVTSQTALRVTTVLRCAAVLADGVSTVPIKFFRRDAADDRVPVTDLALAELFADGPNEWQSTVEFREMQAIHAALTGGAFAFKNTVRGQVRELIPFLPGMVTVRQDSDYRLWYEVRGEKETKTFSQDLIWHLRGPSWNGWEGLDPVRQAREAIGLSMATEEAHAKLHANGVQLSGLVSIEGNLEEDKYKKLKAWIDKEYASVANRHKVMLLDRGSKFTPMGMTGVDAQHLETRRFQIEEVCRALGVNPIMVYVSDKNATYAGSEQQFLSHVVNTVRPWHRRIEASIRKQLLTKEQRAQGIYPKFIDTELLRGAAAARADYYSKALGAGGSPPWMTQNEVRAAEDMPRRSEKHADELPPGTNPGATNPGGAQPGKPAAKPPAPAAEDDEE